MEEIDIREFLKYLKKFIIPAIVTPIIAATAVLIYESGFKVPTYKATTKVILTQTILDESKDANQGITLNDININQKLVATYNEIAKTNTVLENTIKKLDLDITTEELAKKISVSEMTDTVIINISVVDEDPEMSAKISNRIAKEFINEVVDKFNLNNAHIMEEAKTPTMPNNNTLTRDLAIAALVSVFGVIGIAFVIFYFDNTIKFSEDLEKTIDMPVIGKVIKSDVDKKLTQESIVVESFPKAAVSESIKALRTNLQFSSVDNNLQTILITSSSPSEGKTFISSNLAASFAQNGKKTLIVDCDLRKGRLHQVFNALNTLGLSNLLLDDIESYKKYIQKTKIKNLSVITRGAYPPNPSELLSSEKNQKLIELLKTKFDIIIFDGAPCTSVTDSVVMSARADKVLIVARDSKTTLPFLETTRETLRKVNAPIAGAVINDVNRKNAKYYGYYGDK